MRLETCATNDVVEGNKRENDRKREWVSEWEKERERERKRGGGERGSKSGRASYALNATYIHLRDGTSSRYSHEYGGLRASRQPRRNEGGGISFETRGIIFLAFILSPARREDGLPASLSPRFRESGSNLRYISVHFLLLSAFGNPGGKATSGTWHATHRPHRVSRWAWWIRWFKVNTKRSLAKRF